MAAIDKEAQRIINRICANDETLTTAFLDEKNLGDDGSKQLALALQNNSYLTYLSLRENTISVEGLNYIIDAIVNNKKLALTYLDLSGNEISFKPEINTEMFVRLIKGNTSLKVLRFENIYDRISWSVPNVKKDIFDELLVNKTLERFNFTGVSSLEYREYCPIKNVLINNKTLLRLSLSLRFNDKKFEEIINGIAINQTLEKITLKSIFVLHTTTIDGLIKTIISHPKLTSFWFLSHSKKTEDYLFDPFRIFIPDYWLLVKYDKLTTLCLARCEFRKKTTKLFAKYLMRNKSLKKLILSDCIESDNIKYIAQALAKNKTLLYLSLSNNKTSKNDIKALVVALNNNKTLQYLNLSGCRIIDRQIKILCEVLPGNKTLKALELSHNYISNEGFKLIAKSLSNNKTLRHLPINDNEIDVDCAYSVLPINTTLWFINCHFNFENEEELVLAQPKLDIINSLLAKNREKDIAKFLMQPEICEIPWNISGLKKAFGEENKCLAKICHESLIDKMLSSIINKVNMCLFSYAANKNTPQGFPIELITKIGDYVFEDDQGMSDTMIARCNKYAGIGFNR